MDIIFLIKLGLSLTVVLVILVYVLFLKPSKKKKTVKKTTKVVKERTPTDLKYLSSIIKNREIDTKTLKETLDLVLKYHVKIPNKIGTNNHPNFVMYEDIIFAICRHPNTKSTIISKFTSVLEKENKLYKSQINDALTKGLNSRM